MIDRWRTRDPEANEAQLRQLLDAIADHAEICELSMSNAPEDAANAEGWVNGLRLQLDEIETSLIPFGMHVIGSPMTSAERTETVAAIAQAGGADEIDQNRLDSVLASGDRGALNGLLAEHRVAADDIESLADRLVEAFSHLVEEFELPALIDALDAKFIPPVSGGDLIRNPESLPTGRNIHGFDPFRLPSAFALIEGERQAKQLLNRHLADSGTAPTSVALVLWGTDNLKSEGVAIGQALALMGARPRFDSYGRLSGAELIPVDQLGRSRVDVIVTLSGIFRDLLPMQTRLLAEAAYLAAAADEPLELNPIRRSALEYQAKHNCNLDTAALRVFSNSEGAYGSNVNMLVDSGRWDDESEFADAYTNRKGFAYGRNGAVSQQTDLLNDVLGNVDLAYQNLDSVELGITTVDHYFDTLGGISSAVQRAKGNSVPVYIADHTGSGDGKVRTLDEQVALETRTRLLNPKWYESMLDHGYEGVRQIEAHLTNTMGWSATAGGVAPWVYKQVSETFILDEDMRRRLAELNPVAASRVANRLIEAQERDYWGADEEKLEALRRAGEDLEDLLEGISGEVAA
jgi:magnesium chelatase subunit H